MSNISNKLLTEMNEDAMKELIELKGYSRNIKCQCKS